MLRVSRDNFIAFVQRIIIVGRQRQNNMAGTVRARIRQLTGVFITDKIDHKPINPAHTHHPNLIFIRRATIMAKLAV